MRGSLVAVLLLAAAATAAATAAAHRPPLPQFLERCLYHSDLAYVGKISNSALLQQQVLTWNKAAVHTPLAVAWPTSTAQVAQAVSCARAAGIAAVARSGGHSYEGYSVMPGTLTVDLQLMNDTQLSADQATATVQAGSRLGQMYYHVWNQSGGAKAAVGGSCPPVGTGGHLTGGGIGFMSRSHGLACDQVVALTMVDASGAVLVANASVNSDLLAAYCGSGGGQFGIVTEFVVKVVDVPPTVTALSFTVAGSRAQQQLDFLKFVQEEWVQAADPRLGLINLVLGAGGIGVQAQFLGGQAELAALLQQEGLVGPGAKVAALADLRYREMPWIDAVVHFASFDGVLAPADLLDVAAMEAGRSYFKLKSYIAADPLPDAALQAMLDWAAATEAVGGFLELDFIGGSKSALGAVPSNATGFVHRDALFTIQYGVDWQTPEQAAANGLLSLASGLQARLDPYFAPTAPAYINYIDAAVGDHPLAAYYGANLGWLQAVKQQYDPRAFFSSNPLAIPIQPPPPAPPPGASPGPAAGTESAASLRPAVSQAMALPPPAAAPVAAAAAAPEPAPSSGAARAAQAPLSTALLLLLLLLALLSAALGPTVGEGNPIADCVANM